jgi:hypothetical protein
VENRPFSTDSDGLQVGRVILSSNILHLPLFTFHGQERLIDAWKIDLAHLGTEGVRANDPVP